MGRAEDLYERIVREGEAAIEDMIARRQSEELFLDFKRSSDGGTGRRLSPTDRDNLARAISGFGNSEGGLIVWGVDCSPDGSGIDLARARVPITDPQRFVGWLEGAVSGCTLPPHPGVLHHAIIPTGSTEGYVASLIPRSERAPHQVVGTPQYLMRAGSSFLPVPHGVLAGMFGRAPQSRLLQHYVVSQLVVKNGAVVFNVGLLIANAGPGIARDVYVNVSHSGPGGPSSVVVRYSENRVWTSVTTFGGLHSLITQEGIRLPPESYVNPLAIDCALRPPFESALTIRGLIGASGSVPQRFELVASQTNLTARHGEMVGTEGRHDKDVAVAFTSRLFGIVAE